MLNYYTATTLLICLSLGVMCLLVHENARIPGRDKKLLYLTYILIAVSALGEYFGVAFNGRQDLSPKTILLVKAVDYIGTPLAGGALILQLRLKNRWNWFLSSLVALNTLFQLLNPLTGWMVMVDAENVYHHGPLYNVYLGMCLLIIGVVILQFFIYGRSFRRQNRKSLNAILALILIGILMQELSDEQVRTSYLALTIGAALIFIHYVEFGAQAMDDNLKMQQIQLDTDALTGVYSRFAYTLALRRLDEAGELAKDFVVFTVDINGLKRTNDTLGHDAGDELICGAADCITATLCKTGRCYRTGGDEFVVLTHMDRDDVDSALERLRQAAALWSGKTVHKLSLAAGFACAEENEDLSAEKLVIEADKAMYEAKAAYYREAGHDRRQHASRKQA